MKDGEIIEIDGKKYRFEKRIYNLCNGCYFHNPSGETLKDQCKAYTPKVDCITTNGIFKLVTDEPAD